MMLFPLVSWCVGTLNARAGLDCIKKHSLHPPHRKRRQWFAAALHNFTVFMEINPLRTKRYSAAELVTTLRGQLLGQSKFVFLPALVHAFEIFEE